MRVLVLFAHPVETSFCAALQRNVVDALTAAGHKLDIVDLYADDFDPRLSRSERLAYHAVPENRTPVADYVTRLQNAEGLVIVTPIWNFGFPAILKGFFDRVFLPGVSFDLVDGKVKTMLHNISRLLVIATYGGTRLRARLMGDPPRLVVKRYLRVTIKPRARITYLGLYDMNRADAARRHAYLASARTHAGNFC